MPELPFDPMVVPDQGKSQEVGQLTEFASDV